MGHGASKMIKITWIILLLSISYPLAAQVSQSSGVFAGETQVETVPYSKWKDLLALSRPVGFVKYKNFTPITSRTEDLIVNACREGGIEDLYHRAYKASRSPKPMLRPTDSKAFDSILDQVIEIVGKADSKSESYPALLYCFDSIAVLRAKFSDTLDAWGNSKRDQFPEPPWVARQKELSKAGLDFFVTRTAWPYLDRAILRRLAVNYPDTFWGQEAFLEETQSGCDAGVAKQQAQFKVIIARVSRFISIYPDSPFALPLTLELAQAYETWWVLANNTDYDFLGDTSKYREGGEKAREKAILLYKKYLKNQNDMEVTKRIAGLELKKGTVAQMSFYCIDE